MAGQRHHRSRGWKLFLAAVWCFLHFLHISDPALAVNPSLPSNPSDKASALRTNLQQLTVKQLRAELRERGLPVSGRKADLVDRLLTDCWQKFRDWEDKNLAAGRQYELFQLLCQNIDAILMLLDGPVRDYRRLRVCYSAQMFGAGKTTWGDNFLSQINSEDFEDYARKMISKRSQKRQKDWVAEWQRAKEARQLYVDARGRRTVDEVLDVIQQEGNIATLKSSDSVNRFADLVLTIASQEPDRALFVHKAMTSLWYAMASGPPGKRWMISERRRCPGSISFYLVRAFPWGPLANGPLLLAQGRYCWTICIRRVGETNRRGRVKDAPLERGASKWYPECVVKWVPFCFMYTVPMFRRWRSDCYGFLLP